VSEGQIPPVPQAAAQALEKAALENRKLELEIQKSEQELATAGAPEALAQKAAETAKATAVAQKEAAEARQAQVTALIPDMSKVTSGTTEVSGDESLFGSSLAQHALGHAAEKVAAAAAAGMDTPVGDGSPVHNVLVTTEEELATSDAVYQDVMTAIGQLISAGKSARTENQGEGVVTTSFAAPALAAAAQAIPGVISLLSAHRKVSSAALTVENLAAATATAGALRSKATVASVVHDDFRLLPEGTVQRRVEALAAERRQLIARKLELDSERTTATSDLAIEKAAIAALEKQLDGAAANPALQSQLEDHRRTAAQHEKTIGDANTRIGLIDAVVAAIDTFSAALRTVPDGASRSPLATAALREQLHPTQPENADEEPIDPYFSHVLLVKGNPGSTHQVIQDKLIRKDTFTVIAIVNVAYMLIKTSDSHIVAAGNASARATGTGKIGESFELSVTA
jgi:hypothetical protein